MGAQVMENLRYWNQLHKPPTSALKPISGGRLKGKSDISPQWRIKAMTEVFGPCGIGWKYTVDRFWTEKGDGARVAAFAQISLFYKDGDQWSDPVPGIGGSMLVEQESKAPYTSDEAYKMALTDALSVAMKAIGVAAEVYLGNFDGSKFRSDGECTGQSGSQEPRKSQSPDTQPGDMLTIDQAEAAITKQETVPALAAWMNANRKRCPKEAIEIFNKHMAKLKQAA